MKARIGNIVSVSQMLDPNGKNPKDRPAVVVGIDGEQLIVVAISSRMDVFNPSTHVKLSWEHGGHPRTGLNRPSAAVCFWHETIDDTRILDVHKSISEIVVCAIVERMTQAT